MIPKLFEVAKVAGAVLPVVELPETSKQSKASSPLKRTGNFAVYVCGPETIVRLGEISVPPLLRTFVTLPWSVTDLTP